MESAMAWAGVVIFVLLVNGLWLTYKNWQLDEQLRFCEMRIDDYGDRANLWRERAIGYQRALEAIQEQAGRKEETDGD